MPRPKKTSVRFPPVVLIDTAEQHPFGFTGLVGDSKERYLPWIVITKPVSLETGDYSLEGYEKRITVERKSKEDAFKTLSPRDGARERFEAELMRMSLMEQADIVVEAEWSDMLRNPPLNSGLKPKVVIRTVMSYRYKYPNVHWWMCPGRRAAEQVTFQLLRLFYRRSLDGKQ